MSRNSLLQQTMGLGPAWQPRDSWFEQHPAILLQAKIAADAATDAGITPASPQAMQDAMDAEPIAIQLATADAAPAPLPVMPPSPEPSPLAASVATAIVQARPEQTLDWPQLERQVADCQRCRLCETRTQTVFGRGNPKARWLLIGEAPGEQEDRQGLPFVGKAGQLLDNMLAATGLDREQDVYIANVLKCRPPGNRNPAPDEIAACHGYLQQQIHHIQPTLILALGRFAAQTLLQTEESIGRLRGQVHRYQDVPMVVSYHPAYLLRNQPDKAKAWQDLLLAKRVFEQAGGN
ncbi:uracil-DNA glycosylase [Chromobacterium sphagni]|uniref:Type-4 uracil-DNA glycosylase n=1 Tax=Chromobacterium sphagni TaxID=1903179 RepID=A0A1S1X1B6_9NEIS|nr:uracil-DNA glycosylase [Chromobacterium sphagni]OHX13180.1 uracil-DNA glycosylase [Chromobacterium sphagni]